MEEVKKDLEVLWTVEQVANYFHVKKHTVYQWISKGVRLDPNKIVHVGTLVRIPRSEVERIANQKKAKITGAPTTPAAPAAPVIAKPIKL